MCCSFFLFPVFSFPSPARIDAGTDSLPGTEARLSLLALLLVGDAGSGSSGICVRSTVLQVGSADARPDYTGGHTCMHNEIIPLYTLHGCRMYRMQAGDQCKRNLTGSSWGTFLCLMRILYFSSCAGKSVLQTKNSRIAMQCMVYMIVECGVPTPHTR